MFAIIFLFLFTSYTNQIPSNTQITHVSATEAFTYSQDEDVLILDIRTKEEFLSGKIPNAINIDYYSPTFIQSLNQLDKHKTYLVYCRSGNRSSDTIRIMKELGFTSIIHLEKGIISWTQHNLPLI